MLEGTDGKVDRVRVGAGGAVVSNGDSDGFAVLGVSDLNLLAAEARLVARIAVASLIYIMAISSERALLLSSIPMAAMSSSSP